MYIYMLKAANAYVESGLCPRRGAAALWLHRRSCSGRRKARSCLSLARTRTVTFYRLWRAADAEPQLPLTPLYRFRLALQVLHMCARPSSRRSSEERCRACARCAPPRAWTRSPASLWILRRAPPSANAAKRNSRRPLEKRLDVASCQLRCCRGRAGTSPPQSSTPGRWSWI